ncbi:MAG: alkaline phosphatase [Kiritimatiellia bacterium]
MRSLAYSVFLWAAAVSVCGAAARHPAVALPLGAAANASRLDRQAADGRGGWLDMGGNDLHVLPAGTIACGDVPFAIPADTGETDRTCIVLGRKGGAARARLDLPTGSAGSHLYLLHATADSVQTKNLKIGTVDLHYADGTVVRKSVRTGRDVLDWTLGHSCGNAVRAWTRYNDNMQVSLFASKFPTDADRQLVAVEFQSLGECPWMIVAAARGDDLTLKGVIVPLTLTETFRTPPPPARPLPAVPAGQKPRNVILIIGDGMGESLVDFTSRYCHGRPNALLMQQLPVAGHCITLSVEGRTTDSAASATALATGEKTMNGMVGLRARSKAERAHATALVPFTRRAHEKGLAVGLVTNDKLTGATPAGFYGCVRDRGESGKLAEQAAVCGYEILVGNAATDKIFSGIDMAARGYAVVRTLAAFTAARKDANVFGAIDFGTDETALGAGVAETLARLDANPKGFFLMAECATPDGGNHGNRPVESVRGTVMVDWMAKAALDFAVARGGTLVIVTADHETGGVRTVAGADGRVQIAYSCTNHTDAPVALYAFGPGAERFAGTIDNTDVAKAIFDLLDLR